MSASITPSTLWALSQVLFALALIPCAAVALHGRVADRLIALELAGVIETLLLLARAGATHRPFLVDVGLTLALLCFGAGLVFARFLERSR